VIDTGINPNLAEFAGRIDPRSQDIAADRGIVDQEGHGSAVSAVIAANHNGSGMEGVAFDATILSLNTANPNDCDPDDGCSHDDRDIAQAIDIARSAGARVINISLGGDDGASQTLLAAVGRAAADGIVIVISAGNDGAADPDLFASTVADRGAGQVILAGAMTSARVLAGFSDRAGSSADAYLVALGDRVRSVDQNGTATLWSGTSFSAPVISAAAALLAQAFPNLTGQQIVQLLFSSADDAGTAGVDAQFGQGILNIARAFAPQGDVSVAGTRVALADMGAGTASSAMGDASPGLDGVVVLDGFSRAYVADFGRRLALAPSQRPLAQGLQPGLATRAAGTARTLVSLTVRRDIGGHPEIGFAQAGMTHDDLRQARALAGYALSRVTPDTAIAFGIATSGRTLSERLSVVDDSMFLVARDPMARSGFDATGALSFGVRQHIGPVNVTFTGERGHVDRFMPRPGIVEPGYSSMSIGVDRRVGPARLSLAVTRLDETRTVLGGSFAFAPGGARTTFADMAARYDPGGGWSAAARYRRGWTAMPGGNGLVGGGHLSTDAWSLDLARTDALRSGDRIAFRIMQPLRVRAGGYRLDVPVSYDYATLGIGTETRLFSLAPDGRELDVEAAYGLAVLRGAGYLTGNAYYRRDPGNIDAMPDDLGMAVRLSFGF
jgi:hypothetical protein